MVSAPALSPTDNTAAAAPGAVCFVGLGNLPVLAPQYSSLRAGGAELQQTLLARALARRGWRVSMVVADHGQTDGQVWDGVKTYKAYRPHEGIPVLRFLHPRWTKLHAALRRADADIYYTSCAGGHLAQVALFTRGRDRKLVFRIASDTDCDPRTLLVRHWRDRMLYRWGLQHADLVLAQTPSQRRALAHNFGRDSRVAGSLLEASRRCPPAAERDIGAEVGHGVLDAQQLERGLATAQRRNRNSDCGIRFVDLADRGHAQARLGDSASVHQPGAAAVAGSRIDLVELDHQRELEAPAMARIRMTMTIAAA